MATPPSGTCSVCQAPVLAGVRRCPCCGSGLPGRAADALLRTELQAALGAEFDVRERIARGGTATVFRARQRRLDRWVALKVQHPGRHDGAVARARFLHGVLVLAHLDHPHVIPLYETPECGERGCMVMPLVPESVASVLLAEGRFAPREAARILLELALALDHVHGADLLHRDIKPQHVLLEGPARHVRLIDFSLARVAGPEAGSGVGKGEVVGTPAYMSPEQAEGCADLDERSDIYSLGVVGYQLLTGMVPFEGTAEQQLEAHRTRRTQNPTSRFRDIPGELGEVVMRCLAKLPQHRFASAVEVAEALVHFVPATA
jgi:serine/threonine protein kinase